MLLAGDVIVSELMAQNDGLVLDFDQNSPDWLELHNQSDQSADLSGWYLTDSQQELKRWQIPSGTSIEPHGYLLIFASGRDFVTPDGELHTNFRLRSGGEFLALVHADGETAEWQSRFPPQSPNVSFGLIQRNATTQFVWPTSPANTLVPVDDSLGTDWTTTGFDDRGWTTGSASVGFAIEDTAAELIGFSARMIDISGGADGKLDSALEARDLLDGIYSVDDYLVTFDSTDIVPHVNFGGSTGNFRENLPFLDGTLDSSLDDIALRFTANVTIPAGDWTIGMGTDDGGILRLSGVNFGETYNEAGDPDLIRVGDDEILANPIRGFGWTRASFSVGPEDLTTALDVVVFKQEGRDAFELAITNEQTSGRPSRNNDAWQLLADGVLGWNVTTTAVATPNLSDLLHTDLATTLHRQNPSVYVRAPFQLEDTSTTDQLLLRMRYADAFVAYLNGVEVARGNLADRPAWNSVAASLRRDADARVPEVFDISEHLDILRVGDNVLAIQGITSGIDDFGFLNSPQLWGIEQRPVEFAFLEMPTPGAENHSGAVAVLGDLEFSRGGGTFDEPFSLEITAGDPAANIHYTLDGSLPDESSLLYREPLLITHTTQLRVRALRPNYVPSPLVNHTYIYLTEDARDFTSNLPLIVLENYQQGVPGRQWQTGYAAVYEPDASGRSSLTNPPQLTSRIGMQRRGAITFDHPKSNYRIEFRDGRDNDQAQPLLGMPTEADWVFFGPWIHDRAMVRHGFLFSLSNQIGFYSPRTRYVELFADVDGAGLSSGDYMGVYVVMERIKRDPNRVDIEKVERSDLSKPNITGGYIFKKDQGELPDLWKSAQGEHYVHVEPNDAELYVEQRDYLENFVDEFESALHGPNFTDPELGYEAFIDVDSFIDGHLLRLLSNDPDGLKRSQFYVKDRGEKLKNGPLWDFDRTMGNDDDPRSNDPQTFEPSVHYLQYEWWGRLFEDPDFTQRWIDRYQQLRSKGTFSADNFAAIIDPLAAQLTEAQPRNVERWPVTEPNGGPFAAEGLTGWEAELSQLKGWLRARIQWLDSQFLTPPTFSHPSGQVQAGFEVALGRYPLPLYYTTDGSDPRREGGEINGNAVRFAGESIVVNANTKIVARALDVDGEHLTSWSAPAEAMFSVNGNGVIGDLTGDEIVDARDIDRLYAAVHAVDFQPSFDLSPDGQVDQADVQELVHGVLGTRFGDIDLDGDVDVTDFDVLVGNFARPSDSWSSGDFDGDGVVDFQDFVWLTNNFGFS